MWLCRLPPSAKRPDFLKKSLPANFAPRSNKLAVWNRPITKVTPSACCAASPKFLAQLSASPSNRGMLAFPPTLASRNARFAPEPLGDHEATDRAQDEAGSVADRQVFYFLI